MRKRIMRTRSGGALIKRKRKRRNETRQPALEPMALALQQPQHLALRRIVRPATECPDRQRREEHGEPQITRLVIEFSSELAPRAINGIGLILPPRNKHRSNDIRGIDIRSKLPIADLAFLGNRKRLV
jgi:hypothetical protein